MYLPHERKGTRGASHTTRRPSRQGLDSPYGAPVLFVRKKNKDLRLCIDYRKLNAQTVKNAGRHPRIDDLLERLGGATYFSKLDLKSGYHQIEIQPQDRYKTTFKTWYGHFEWVVMPFGLVNAPATFQATMTTEFRDLRNRSVLIYLDDILVYSRTLDEHIAHLRAVLDRLRLSKYKANLDKCEFAKQELEYLGHFVTPKGIRPLADKIQAIVDWSEPRCTTDVRSFMGLAGYYQRFVESYSKVAAPLSRLQSPKVPFEFADAARSAFTTLKAAMQAAPTLRIYDPTLPTQVTTDASGYGIGAVLEQCHEDGWHPIEYFSQKVPLVNTLDDARKKERSSPWHDPQGAQKATDAINNLCARRFKDVRELTDIVERLLVVPGVRFDQQVLLTNYLRCLPAEVRTKLVDEAYVEQHTFASCSKKALDIEAKLGSAHKASHDGRKRLPQDWKKKGQLMFVDHDSQTTEIDDFPDLGELTEHDGASETSDGGVVAPIKEKARGTGKKKVVRTTGQGDQGTPAWVKIGLDCEVWRDRVARGTCMKCGNYGHTSRTCRSSKVSTKVASPTVVGLSSNPGSASASSSQGNTSGQ
ncbi:hypothetical protein CBR_g4229 [Chara braunii]|uniref:CCHC-type domain-containing protein n=1 Tax=Chara braunii TaxID=69332 RepID=A0A388JR47_CHABU|nr:hypothetical protein CBR_g4229 [Chara braunii]|eukprot:GBG60275.1 hypothetical protein CBR_g4229 [Chara braunii]